MNGLARDIIDGIIDGTIADREQLQREKIKLCEKYGLSDVPLNSAILAVARPEEREAVLPFLTKKPVRTASGVAVVAVMTSPHPCPHGKCRYCPGGVDNGSPQSYTGKEPAARRAERNEFDPYRQVVDRLTQLEAIGHRTDKIDLIIMGGTFTSREEEYQTWFVKRCFEAMNGIESETLEAAQELNSLSKHRCVGLTVETRPDVFGAAEIERAMLLGATRVELGVQILDDAILEAVNRGHGTEVVRNATRECRSHGLKVCYHIMPGLPGSSPEKDLESFKLMFDDPAYKPDMLKFYTTLVIEGTELYDMWKAGEYEPYDMDTAVKLLSEMKSIVPEYVRIQRVQRDIPAPQIAAGITKSNIREVVQKTMSDRGQACRCIRCREVGHNDSSYIDGGESVLSDLTYEASGGTEHFINLAHDDHLIGYVRLRLDGSETASIRELKVFGSMAAIGEHGGKWQHSGFGKILMGAAESEAKRNGASMVRITSGVGVREYYRSLGYSLERPYMVKRI